MIKRYFKRIFELGLIEIMRNIKKRVKKRFFIQKFKKKVFKKQANHTWRQISKKRKLDPNFNDFLKRLKQQNFIEQIFPKLQNLNEQEIIKKADLATNNCFEIWGKQFCFKNKIDWHQDFKTKTNNNNWKIAFYSDIKIKNPKSQNISDYNPDIKVPWELSRFQHLYFLGKAFQQTKDEKYTTTFQKQTSNWINENRFLIGVNWVCPMEIAIRAINFIYAFHFFKHSKKISIKFWQKIVCSLYDHMIYLENNWEESDKPNNHYLSDLIGYFYLTFFFSDFKNIRRKQKWIIKKLLKQFDHQIQADGASYEGSTSYHKLVTEIFWHFKILCETNNIKLPKQFHEKLNKMFEFIQNCTDHKSNFVQIGDNDSGRILYPPTSFILRQTQKQPYSHYPNFGLTIIVTTIIKNKNCNNNCWRITFRHPTFNKKQPTGHFHQDELSITFSINGIPVLVDPGTYLYTANPFARNYFRSYRNHNTFYLDEKQKFNDLFQLPRKAQKDNTKIENNKNKIIISNQTQNNLKRILIFDKEKEFLEIQDSIENSTYNKTINWNFIFHPNINLEKKDNNWIIKIKDKKVAKISSTLNFEKAQGFYSDGYGKIETCEKLVDRKQTPIKIIKTIFKKI